MKVKYKDFVPGCIEDLTKNTLQFIKLQVFSSRKRSYQSCFGEIRPLPGPVEVCINKAVLRARGSDIALDEKHAASQSGLHRLQRGRDVSQSLGTTRFISVNTSHHNQRRPTFIAAKASDHVVDLDRDISLCGVDYTH